MAEDMGPLVASLRLRKGTSVYERIGVVEHTHLSPGRHLWRPTSVCVRRVP